MLLVTLLFLVATIITYINPAFAGDATKGAQVFSANCASCHPRGKNVVNPAKTLHKSDLQKYDKYSLEAIKTQVTKGKNAMPSFGGRLSTQQIEDVATYVLSQSEKGW